MSVNFSLEGLESSDSSTEDEGMDIVGSFVSVHSLKIADVSDDMILIYDSITSEHVSSLSCDI